MGKQLILTLICRVQVEVLEVLEVEVHYHVSSFRGNAVLDSLNPSIRQDDRVLASHHAPVTRLLLVEVQPVVIRDSVAVPVGPQGRVGGRLSGGLLSLALSGWAGGCLTGASPSPNGVH